MGSRRDVVKGPGCLPWMKVVVRLNQNNVGIYDAVIRIGQLTVGQPIFLRRERHV